ncbi:MAG: ADP-glyceromanno-heptose 6-epimerase [Steroidobacteraceae bacterium]
MYLVTGGAGFIGSNVAAALSERNHEVVVSDWLRDDERWRNLAKHEISEIIDPETMLAWLHRKGDRLRAVIHMGAISATTETNVDLIAARNIRATLELIEWCTQTQVPLIYASSAATYGDGTQGFDDSFTRDSLKRLRPLNAYGWSKHVIDRRIARMVEEKEELPPQWVGLKFFNVYGPNEYHKESMRSVIAKNFSIVQRGDPLRLFRSYRADYADGGQKRDFIYVRDCVDVILWFLDNPNLSGLYNLGTGQARTWMDLANALFAALGRSANVEIIDMPIELQPKYQYFTEAIMDRLREIGYQRPFTSLETGIGDYVRQYLINEDPYR